MARSYETECESAARKGLNSFWCSSLRRLLWTESQIVWTRPKSGFIVYPSSTGPPHLSPLEIAHAATQSILSSGPYWRLDAHNKSLRSNLQGQAVSLIQNSAFPAARRFLNLGSLTSTECTLLFSRYKRAPMYYSCSYVLKRQTQGEYNNSRYHSEC